MYYRTVSRYKYNRTFFKYIAIGSASSARVIVPIVVKALTPASILDVGCGAGAWLKEYLNCGVGDCLGADGEYVDVRLLLVPKQHFKVQDVTHEFDVGRRYDLVQCLEVGEHLPCSASQTLVDNLTAHSDRVLFSAAVPGQGGENHINEQTYEFWRRLFAKRAYVPFDFIRPRITRMPTVEPWYRYNLILYVHVDAVSRLPDLVRRTGVPDTTPIPDVSPVSYRLRKALLRHIPSTWSSQLAILKHRSILTLHKTSEWLHCSSLR